jgi:hypothetical protein
MSEFTIIPDCLVLKLEECEEKTNIIDTTVYIFYDKNQHQYVVRGRRKWTPNHKSCTYSFNCTYVNDLVYFLQYIICRTSKVNETLFNYDNFPASSSEITFEFLQNYDHGDYEISGYDEKKLQRKRLLKNLTMLRNVSNVY